MKLNCLITNTSAVNDIKDALIGIAKFKIESNEPVKFENMYALLKDQGFEIDAESAGYIYNEAFGTLNSNKFSDIKEIEAYANAEIKSQVSGIVGNILGEEKEGKERQIGKLSEEKRLAKMVASMFDKKYFAQASSDTMTIMKEMGKLLEKAIKNNLPKANQAQSKSLNDALQNFFEVEDFKVNRLDGGINNLSSMQKAFKKEVQSHIDLIIDKLPDNKKQLVREQWESYTDQVVNSIDDILLGSAETDKLLKGTLSQIKIDGNNIVDKNGTILWDNMSSSLNQQQAVENISKALQNGYVDNVGKEVKYTKSQADRIANYLGRALERKVADAMTRKIANERVSQMQPRNIISDFLKDKGWFNLRKDKNGVLSKAVSNWNNVIDYLERKGNADIPLTMAELKKEFGDYIAQVKDKQGNLLFPNQSKIDEVVEAFGKTLEDKLLPTTMDATAMEKIVALTKVNGGKAFNEQTQSALNKLVGISGLDQNTLNKLESLGKLIDSISNHDIDGTPKSMGDFADQALSQIDRLTKEIINDFKQDKSGMQKVVKTISAMMSASASTLLVNPYNFSENIATAVSSSIIEIIRIAFAHPKQFTKAMKDASKTFALGGIDHASGGSHGNVYAEQDLSIDVAQGERLRLRSFEKMGFKKLSDILKNVGDTYSILINTVNRVLMNSVDASFNEGLAKIIMYDTVYSALKENKGKDVADNIMETALNVTPKQKQEIDDEATDIINKMKQGGLHPTMATKALIKRQMLNALYREAMTGIFTGNQAQKADQATKALLNASKLATKQLMGKKRLSSNDYVSVWAYQLVTQGLVKLNTKIATDVQKQEKKGNYKRAALEEGLYEFLKTGPIKFIGGRANFLLLGLSGTPVGGLQAWSIKNQIKELKEENASVGVLDKMTDPEKTIKYYELKQMYKAIVARAIVGNISIALALTYFLMPKGDDGDDDDDGFFANLMKTKSGQRMLAKESSLGIYLTMLATLPIGNKKLDQTAEFFKNAGFALGGEQFDNWDMMIKGLNREKDPNKRLAIVGKFASAYMASGKLNQIEDYTKARDVFISGVTGNTNQVEKNEKIQSDVYKKMDSFIDGIVGDNMISTIARVSRGEDLNRFDKDAMSDTEFQDSKLIDLYGVGEKNLPELKKKGIKSVDDLNTKSKSQLMQLGFTEAEAIRLRNDFSGNGYSENKVEDLNLNESEIRRLKALGYSGIDEKNVTDAIKNLKSIRTKHQVNVDDKGKVTSLKKFVNEKGEPMNVDDKKAIDEINNIIKELKNPTNK